MKIKKIFICAVITVLTLAFTACLDFLLPTLTGIKVQYTPTKAIITSTPLDDLKAGLTVTASYDDSTSRKLNPADYRLSGTLAVGSSTITVTYEGKTDNFTVTVLELKSIKAQYTGTTPIYTTTPLNNLKAGLTVTASYNNNPDETLNSADYALSGTLTVGSSAITVTYGDKTATFNVTVSAFRKFWATNFTTDKDYQLEAELLAEGRYCNVWVEKGSGIGKNEAERMANVYDNDIYVKMINNFSFSNEKIYGIYFSNAMEFADFLGDDDGKLCILLLDIKDGYQKGVNDAYVAGYFWAGDLYDNGGSNICDMIYVDTNPGAPGSEESNKTVAHEMQHMINFITSLFKRDDLMDTWIDEGLASAAEWVYSGKINQDRVNWFNNNGSVRNRGLIDRGNNFFVWGNRENESIYANLDDYSTVYLFFQWLRIQGGNDIYKKIITSEYSNHNAVVSNISGYSSWDSLLETWLAANRINSTSGRYGYNKGTSGIDVKVTYAPRNVTSVQLYPGEGVYSLANIQPATTSNTNIVYKYITSSGVGNFSAGSTLLTYNKNTNLSATPVNGTVTGVAPAANTSAVSANGSRSVVTTGPYRIDAGDLLRRNGWERNFSGMDISGLRGKAVNDE